jgi:hypothetical protein
MRLHPATVPAVRHARQISRHPAADFPSA